jgi:hypothetical protein
LCFTATAAVAATLDAPDEVCVGEAFEVEWTGPDADGDFIAIAYPDAAPDVYDSSRETRGGNPAILRAPLVPGTYEIRYVQREPLTILARREIEVTNCMSASQGGSCSLPEYPADSYALLVHGVQSESGMQLPQDQAFTLEQLCMVGDAVGSMLGELLNRVQVPLDVPLSMIRNNVANQLRGARDAVCSGPPGEGREYWFTVTYAHCRMAMDTLPHSMDIHLPPGLAEGTMSMADHGKREITQLTLKRNIDAVSEFVGTGWGGTINMAATQRSGSHVGFSTREYRFEQTGGLGVPGLGATTEADVYSGGVTSPQALGNLISVKNEGTAWIADCVPGINIVKTFYENLSREVQPEQGATSFIAGLINSTVAMLEKGLPLESETTISSRLAGVTKITGSSHTIITGFDVVPLPPQWCADSLMPEGYAVTDIDQQVAEVMSGAPGGSNSSAEVAEGMQQFNEAMQQLTPEQRRLMEQYGLGDLQQGPASPSPGTTGGNAAGSTMPPPEDLYSDNLTQMVQRHLEALGYEPGNTTGDLSTDTIIAISQFQAEHGLKATGEVTPQLVGVLSAEVDKRR